MKITKRILAAVLCVCLLWCAGLSVVSFAADEQPSYEVEKVELDKNKLSLHYGETYTFKATVSPKEATNYKLVWSSSDDKLAKVDANGKVTVVEATDETDDLAKTVTITVAVSGKSSIKDTCTVTVSKKISMAEVIGRVFNSLVTLFTTLYTKFKDPASEAGKTLIDWINQLLRSGSTTTTAA